jgi:superfamily I ATP-dependent helicase
MSENDILNVLNDKQKEVAVLTEGTIRVLAGAGTGKTKTMVHRIAYMVNVAGIKPEEILVFSYTNKAVNEFRERIEILLGEKANLVNIYTFHAFAYKMLKQYGNEELKIITDTYPKQEDMWRYKNYAFKTKDEVFKEIRKTNEKDYKEASLSAKDMMLLFDKIKERRLNINDIDKTFYGNGYLKKIFLKYCDLLEKNDLCDFPDLLLKFNDMLDKPDIIKKIRNTYKYTIVDEFQDTNDLQLEIVKKIIGKKQNLCVVGDDSQSIYAFRGANVNLIINLGKEFKKLKTINLEQNYRSTNTIIEASNNLIENNKNRADKKIWTDNPKGKQITKINGSEKFEEAKLVRKEIEKLKKEGVSYNDIAILYRNNSQSQIIQAEFLKDDVLIPYRVKDPSNFFNKAEIKGLINYLKLIIDPCDFTAFSDCMMKPSRYFKRLLLDQIMTIAISKHNGNLLSAIKDKISIKTNTCANTYNIQALLSLSDMYKEIERMFLKEEGNKVLEYIIRSVNYINGMSLSFYCMNTPKDDLETSIDTLREIYLKNEIKTKEDLIEFLKYVENLDEKAKKLQIPDNDKSVEAVQLTTIHSAKGLEFPYVFVLGMVEDVFPSFRLKENPLDLEEERRLCYVAVTRAKKKLYLCTYDFLITEKGIATTKPSRFIDELNTNFDIL